MIERAYCSFREFSLEAKRWEGRNEMQPRGSQANSLNGRSVLQTTKKASPFRDAFFVALIAVNL
jgi:hypothetical protein